MEFKRLKIEQLSEDPANARVHTDEQIERIKASLRRFGQQRAIVVNKNGVVIAGNGTLRAARGLGWSDIWVTESELTGAEATAYGIADNRLTDLSDFDLPVLRQHLEALRNEDFNLDDIGFNVDELSKLFDEPEFAFNAPGEKNDEEKYVLRVELETDEQRKELFDELMERGMKVFV